MIPRGISKAQVISQDPDNYSVNVSLSQQAGEGPAISVRVLTPGPLDGLLIKQPPLPRRGTLGVVGALDGDSRSMVWLGALPLNGQDAITVVPGSQNVDYHGHFSGSYYLMDDIGNTTWVWPDGSSVVMGSTSGTPTRHIINSEGLRVLVPLTTAERVPNPPSAFPFTYTGANGAVVNVDSEGNISVMGTTLLITAPTVTIVGDVTVQGTLTATEEIHTNLNGGIDLSAHLHSGVTSGASNTKPPVPGT